MHKITSVFMIGPSYPFRGGIAHYTTLLYQELKKSYPVTFFAFKRQYFQFLFPGKGDKDNSSKVPLSIDGIQKKLDTINPFSWIDAADCGLARKRNKPFSTAPRSTMAKPLPFPSATRGHPRWSVGGSAVLFPASTTGLPFNGTRVRVGPPLSDKGPSFGSAVFNALSRSSTRAAGCFTTNAATIFASGEINSNAPIGPGAASHGRQTGRRTA